MTNDLVTIGPLKRALALAAEAGDINKLKDVAAMAAALQKGARARGMGLDAENQAAEVVIRAERAMGSRLAEMVAEGIITKGAGGIARRLEVPDEEASPSARRKREYMRGKGEERESVVRLEDLSVTPAESSKFQLLARIPEEEFERRFTTIKATGTRLAKVDFYRMTGYDKTKRDARASIREEEHAGDATPVFLAFSKAAEPMIEGMSQLPTDELAKAAKLIQRLAAAYGEARNAR